MKRDKAYFRAVGAYLFIEGYIFLGRHKAPGEADWQGQEKLTGNILMQQFLLGDDPVPRKALIAYTTALAFTSATYRQHLMFRFCRAHDLPMDIIDVAPTRKLLSEYDIYVEVEK